MVVRRLLDAVRTAADRDGVAVLLVEQHARQALALADRGYVLRRGRVEIEGDDLKLTLWYHDPDRLRSALIFGGRAEWKPKFHVLYVISSGSFNLATVDKVEPCVPAIRRRPTETTRQFIGRAMRENHGYTVPQHWLVDLDARPDGDTGEPQSGYLVGVDTPTAQEAALLQKLTEEFGDAPATTNPEDIVRQSREQQAD